MVTVYKYPINGTQLSLPLSAKVRHVGLDPYDRLSLWIELDTEEPKVPFNVFAIGTGSEVPAGVPFVGSIVAVPYVLHVYMGQAK